MTITCSKIEAAHSRFAGEPGGATALAALISGAYKPRIDVLLCGANVDLTRPAELAYP